MTTPRPFVHVTLSLMGALGIALVAPLVILLVGLPVVLVVRSVVEAAGWLLAWFTG